jgi:hypothetical protein
MPFDREGQFVAGPPKDTHGACGPKFQAVTVELTQMREYIRAWIDTKNEAISEVKALREELAARDRRVELLERKMSAREGVIADILEQIAPRLVMAMHKANKAVASE